MKFQEHVEIKAKISICINRIDNECRQFNIIQRDGILIYFHNKKKTFISDHKQNVFFFHHLRSRFTRNLLIHSFIALVEKKNCIPSLNE